MLLVITPTFLNLGDKMRHGGFQINEKVRCLHHRHHKPEQVHIGLVVAVRKIAHILVVRHKYVDAFKNRPVLDNHVLRIRNLQNVLEPLG